MKQWLVKGTMAAALLCSPLFIGTEVYASDNTGEENKVEVEAPSLVQGDFFYFVKTMIEDIRLAFATNDLDKAKLLAELAAERIAEAHVLLQEGNATRIQETLETAAENLEKADELSEDAVDVTTTSEATLEAEETREAAAVKRNIAQHIEALAIVLDKVQNPAAKEAIVTNIEKSFTKLAAKIEKEQTKHELIVVAEGAPLATEAQVVVPETPEDIAKQLQQAKQKEPVQSQQELHVQPVSESAATPTVVEESAAAAKTYERPKKQKQEQRKKHDDDEDDDDKDDDDKDDDDEEDDEGDDD